jgi:hypothetical protein
MARTSIATDNFNRASLDSDWAQLNTVVSGNVQIDSSIRIQGQYNAQPTDQQPTARWVGAGSFTDDQYSQIKLLNPLDWASSTVRAGVIVRASADTGAGRDYYEAYIAQDSGTTPTTYLAKWVNGTRTGLYSAAQTWAANDTISLEAEGTTLRVCRNGTPLGGSWTVTDSSISTGLPGVTIAGVGALGDDWEGGNMGASATSSPAIRAFPRSVFNL